LDGWVIQVLHILAVMELKLVLAKIRYIKIILAPGALVL
jgi:hypothetical protein